MNVGRAGNQGCLLHLVHEVNRVGGRSGCHVGSAVGYGNGRHVLLPGRLPDALLAGGRGGRGGPVRSRRRPLDTGIHVGFIVEAEVDKVMTALEGAAQGLHADVGGGTVATVGDEHGIRLIDDVLAVHGFVGGFHATGHSGRIFEGHVHPGHPPGRLGKGRGDDFHAPCGAQNDNVGAQRLHGLPQSQHFSAALACSVTGRHRLHLGEVLEVEPFEILQSFRCDSHYSLTLINS